MGAEIQAYARETHSFTYIQHYAAFIPSSARCSIPRNTVFVSNNPSRHAEIGALLRCIRMPHNIRHNKPTSFDLIIVRLSKTGIVGESRPCWHCLKELGRMEKCLGIKIHRVFYSHVEDGGYYIARESFKAMIHSKNTHISSGNRIRPISMPLRCS
jgi:hypothetical protein